MTREETIERLKELGVENPVDEEGRINLAGADLQGADLTRAHLAHAHLAGANLTRTQLQGTVLAGANLYRADLTGAVYNHRTMWPAGFVPQSHGAILVEEDAD